MLKLEHFHTALGTAFRKGQHTDGNKYRMQFGRHDRYTESIPTRIPAVRCRRHKYASIMACCPIINNDTLAAP